MKNIFFGFTLSLATLSFAQQYPNNGWGDDGYYQNEGSYSDQDDQNYFPDDYYYNYPQDYYPQDYYQSYYNDYRNSIVNVNWNVFFTQNRLSRWQVDQIVRLNNLYVSFSAWNNFYGYNPDRWYYDRFYALERIMGPRVFVVFQNNFYRGYSPVVYFQNYRRTHYVPIYRPIPRYRNVNINVYRVERVSFRRANNPTFNIVKTSSREGNGFRGPVRNGNSGFRTQSNNNVKNESYNNDFRNNRGFRGSADNNRMNNGFRGNNEVRREESKRRNDNGGFRGFNNGGGFRQENGNSVPRQQSTGSERKSSGFRGKLANN
ncbi:hypothetical protein [Chryseobacterium potabilaquae]|uniref:Uncharacterized protein n=1 Tax=Chryseobacterium potabilaquae TaxID=2675057 RepID=A0A6N4X4N1_9FLAO|nr:hypothetical protein [Chryseobacterium potabilaquae]CAA7194200.1 hypothetical protein CHRY9293_00534 [Chryseobacterium potabilaquae]